MTKNDKLRTSGCPIAYGLDMFGDRWTLLVIRDMLLNGKQTYGEFLEAGEGISTNILADRLKHLEASGIIERSPDPENWRKVLYTLTEKGRDLAPVILEILAWSGKHDQRPVALKGAFKQLLNDRDGFETRIRG